MYCSIGVKQAFCNFNLHEDRGDALWPIWTFVNTCRKPAFQAKNNLIQHIAETSFSLDCFMDYILGSLYIGNIDDAHAPPSSISALLWTALENKLDPIPQGVVLGRIPLREYTEAVPMDIESGIAWLERHLPQHQILVACRAGMGRSVSVVIAYLCCVQGMSFEEAVKFVRERRTGTTPLPNLEKTIDKVKKLRAKPS